MLGRIVFFVILVATAMCMTNARAGESLDAIRAKARGEQALNNYRNAAELYRALCLSPDNEPDKAAQDLANAIECYDALGDHAETESLLVHMENEWRDSWRVLAAIAHGYINLPSEVALENERFVRSTDWGRHLRDASERDRVKALQLMEQAAAMRPADADADAGRTREFYRQYAEILLTGRGIGLEWRLSALTDTSVLPEPDEGNIRYTYGQRYAPADNDGNPLFYAVPETWDSAKNDGERWRWLLAGIAGNGDESYAAFEYAMFLVRQFDVQTLAGFFPFRSNTKEDATGPLAVRTLRDDETIARLATGIKRFTLPYEHDFIRILRSLDGDGAYGAEANNYLAQVFENRQQYPKAVSRWRKVAESGQPSLQKKAVAEIERITGKNGMLKPTRTAPAGVTPTLSYLFRNGESVHFTAERLDEQRLLSDVRMALRENKQDNDRFNPFLSYPEQIGRLVVEENKRAYVVDTTAEWSVRLEPLPDHLSRTVSIDLPFTGSGCYLVTAAMDDGNVSRSVIWIADLALTEKTIPGSHLWFVADAGTGQPVANATVTFFTASIATGEKPARIITHETAEKTDENGLIVHPIDNQRSPHGALTIVTAPDGRMAYQGFDQLWGEPIGSPRHDQANAYFITDRPVYRPGQTMRYAVWFGQAHYDDHTQPDFSGKLVTVTIRNPRGEAVAAHDMVIDGNNSVSGELALDDNALLGIYGIEASGFPGSIGFRLEEYKKPEYEVTVETPKNAVPLGDTAEIIVSAQYYYGAPVANATALYTITRTAHTAQTFPSWRWDWLYGKGAWRQAESGPENMAKRVSPMVWPPINSGPPEIVMRGDAALDSDGTFRIALDTLPAKELFGSTDHRYVVTVEVRDESRRTISGSGTILATRDPFSVAVWADNGWYEAGDIMSVNVQATLPSGSGIAATGEAVLSRLTVDKGGAVVSEETERLSIATGKDGLTTMTFRPDRAGQYKLAVTLAEQNGKPVAGQTVITVRGGGNNGGFSYGELEVTPDKREYVPGETVRLAINSSRDDAAVILIVRPEQGGEISLVRLENGTALVEIPVTETDQPNFYCDAMVVFDGQLHSRTQQIFVPPAPKALSVAIESDKERYLPGEEASFTVTVSDAKGNPIAGNIVVAMYDRAVEYISGGSNVPPIQEYFWGWRRYYYPRTNSTLQRNGYNVFRDDDTRWLPIGAFGELEVDWNDGGVYAYGEMEMARLPRPAPAGARNKDFSTLSSMIASPVADALPPAPASAAEQSPGTGGAFAGTVVRSDFADTAFWKANLQTDRDGKATFSLTMPDNLTDWKTRVWSMADGARVGEAEHTVVTRKNIIIRPQAPRFLTQTDQAALSANLHNYLPRAKSVRAEIALEGGLLQLAEGSAPVQEFQLDAGGEARADWTVNALHPGVAVVIMKLFSDEESDAAEIRIPVVLHGARRIEQMSGMIRRIDNGTIINFRVPEKILPEQSKLRFSFSSGIAAQMLDALPYLIDYPYDCTEQTLNRFMPVLMTRGYLDGLGLSLADARKAMNKPDDARADAWKERFGDALRERALHAVFDDGELDKRVREGVDRLAAMQNADGGWGWFSGYGEQSGPHTTAIVMHGLLTAREMDIALPAGMLERGLEWLFSYRRHELDRIKAHFADPDDKSAKHQADNMDAFIDMILLRAGRDEPEMRDFLYRDRASLSLTGLAMLGIALHQEGATKQLEAVLENLRQFLRQDSNGTMWLESGKSSWWYWYNDSVELQAWYLMLLNRADPKGDVAAGVAQYLLANRKNGSYWRSTRDTGYAIEALTGFAVASGEGSPDMTVEVYYGGAKVMERRLTAANILENNEFILDGVAVKPGRHDIKLIRTGNGAVYFGGALDVFSLEDPIPAAGGDLAVTRTYYKLHRTDGNMLSPGESGQAESVRTERYRRERLEDPFMTPSTATLSSGDLVEVELTIVNKNDYEYLVFEDMKAAGLEAVEVRSGYSDDHLGAYVEYRDEKVVLFIRWLPRGTHTVRYRFRAEAPGRFSALPVGGGGMYAPELSANSNEMKLSIQDSEER